VFGVPHERLGEEVAAAIVPKPGRTLEPDALRSFLAQHLAPFKIPTRIELKTDALPRNPAGKILKRALRDELAASS
jgi:acyl-CoA synthetase (AMP-forming)/AMP-acid ligase II